MRRQDRYPETQWFHYFNANPKGRITGDCTFRAIAVAMDKTWDWIVLDMASAAIKHKYSPNDAKGIAEYLKMQGWTKHPQPRRDTGKKYTGKQFCEWLERNYKGDTPVIANIGGHHIVCIRKWQGKWRIWDIWDSSDKCVGNFWMKHS